MLRILQRTRDDKVTNGHYHTGWRNSEKHVFARPCFYVDPSLPVGTVVCAICHKETSLDKALNTYFQYLEDLCETVERNET